MFPTCFVAYCARSLGGSDSDRMDKSTITPAGSVALVSGLLRVGRSLGVSPHVNSGGGGVFHFELSLKWDRAGYSATTSSDPYHDPRAAFFRYPFTLVVLRPTYLSRSHLHKSRLSAIYLDEEAHVAHESKAWRPAYAQLHLLRRVCGLEDVPMVAISATLPTCMEYGVISFREIAFVFSGPITANNPESMDPAMILTDDIERLTATFWWRREQLRKRRLPLMMDLWWDLLLGLLTSSWDNGLETLVVNYDTVWQRRAKSNPWEATDGMQNIKTL
ncbi:hypothetical protein DFP72DRAFT_855315 [Ephemerocybe angulata]|uniref:Uncharacterized protein n=1 Tax=Ephemerocybe angulata TaxID=980116 RepID=A0A8H6HGK2_9AGAR|nr:hypothetical protein DFP72DRAFT_855310 [Tulosesus angulatus]KAF6746613.1 hypothetical protein DFP72DRAFT_855315 [Tulosesus angulatus]